MSFVSFNAMMVALFSTIQFFVSLCSYMLTNKRRGVMWYLSKIHFTKSELHYVTISRHFVGKVFHTPYLYDWKHVEPELNWSNSPNPVKFKPRKEVKDKKQLYLLQKSLFFVIRFGGNTLCRENERLVDWRRVGEGKVVLFLVSSQFITLTSIKLY